MLLPHMGFIELPRVNICWSLVRSRKPVMLCGCPTYHILRPPRLICQIFMLLCLRASSIRSGSSLSSKRHWRHWPRLLQIRRLLVLSLCTARRQVWRPWWQWWLWVWWSTRSRHSLLRLIRIIIIIIIIIILTCSSTNKPHHNELLDAIEFRAIVSHLCRHELPDHYTSAMQTGYAAINKQTCQARPNMRKYLNLTQKRLGPVSMKEFRK